MGNRRELEIIESSIGEFKAFWTLNNNIKYVAFKHHEKFWCLCYDGFSIGNKECPIIADEFKSLSECMEYSLSL